MKSTKGQHSLGLVYVYFNNGGDSIKEPAFNNMVNYTIDCFEKVTYRKSRCPAIRMLSLPQNRGTKTNSKVIRQILGNKLLILMLVLIF